MIEPAAEASSPRPWSAFRFRDFRILWAIGLVVVISLWLRILVTGQWLLEETGSAAQVGFIGAVQLVVQVPALLYGGALADRLDRKPLITAAQATTCGVLFALGVLDSAGVLVTWHVYLAIAATAVTQVFSSPAAAALTPSVVPQRYLMLAITVQTATQTGGAIVGPLVFAVAARFLGLTAVFFVAAGCTSPAVILPLLIRTRGRPEQTSEGSTIQRVWEGFRFVARHPILPGLFLLDVGITVVSFYREILPVLARGLFRGGSTAAGVLGSANSAGAVCGSFAALFFAGYRAKGMLVLYASLAYAIVLFAFGSVTTLWAGAITIALLGGADAVTVAVRQTTVQLTTPDYMRGRAYAFMVLVAQSANNIGTLWVGIWSELIGAAETMLMGAVLALLATLVIWRAWRPIREYRDASA